MTVFGKTNWLARIALLPFMSSEDAAVQIQTFHVRVKCTSFSLASSCSNPYIRAYVIINFLADWLVFLIMVSLYLPFLLDLSFSIFLLL